MLEDTHAGHGSKRRTRPSMKPITPQTSFKKAPVGEPFVCHPLPRRTESSRRADDDVVASSAAPDAGPRFVRAERHVLPADAVEMNDGAADTRYTFGVTLRPHSSY